MHISKNSFNFNEQENYFFSLESWSILANQALLKHFQLKNNAQYLDVGCGIGSLFSIFPQQIQLDGVDISSKNIAFAQKHFPQRNFYKNSAEFLPFKTETYDGCLMSLVLPTLQNAEKVLLEMVRVTKKGEIIAISTWDLPSKFPYAPVFETLFELDFIPKTPDEIATLTSLERLENLAKSAFLTDISLQSLTVSQIFDDFDAYFQRALKFPHIDYFSSAQLEKLEKTLKKRFIAPFQIDAQLNIMTGRKSFNNL